MKNLGTDRETRVRRRTTQETQVNGLEIGPIAGPRAVRAPVVPDLAAPAAAGARATHGNVERDRGAAERLLGGDLDVRTRFGAGTPAKERLPHAIEHGQHRRKIDVDVIRQVVGDRHGYFLAGNVRMIAASQLAMGPLDLVRARVGRHAEDVVIVAHRLESSYHARRGRPQRMSDVR